MLTKWRGLAVPMLKTPHTLATNPTHVSITRESRGTGKSTHIVFPVRVHQPPGDLIVLEPKNYAVSRRAAEALANALTLGMHDTSSGTPVIREAGTLDEPLRDRLLREHGSAPAPSETPPGRLTTRFLNQAQVCDLPRPGFNFRLVGYIVIAATVPIFIAFPLSSWGSTGHILIAAVAAAAAIIIAVSLIHMLSPSRVHLTAEGITYERRLRPRNHIPADTLEEVIIVPRTTPTGFDLLGIGGHVLLRSDTHSTPPRPKPHPRRNHLAHHRHPPHPPHKILDRLPLTLPQPTPHAPVARAHPVRVRIVSSPPIALQIAL